MNGRPVWLASISLRNPVVRNIVGTSDWGPSRFRQANTIIDTLLEGLGNPEMQRAFRMNVTLCRHRALRPSEEAKLHPDWHATLPMDLAGGPIESLWHRGYDLRPSIYPCHDPEKMLIDRTRPDLWVPVDCGECQTCLDRQRARAGLPPLGR